MALHLEWLTEFCQDGFWTQHWVPFTDELGLDPFLVTVEDKVPMLRILAHQIRDGRASHSGQPVRAECICDEILAIAKGYTNMGLLDPCLTSYGDMDPRLINLYTSYKNADPAPHRVKPLPIQVLHRAQALVARPPRPRPPSTWPGAALFWGWDRTSKAGYRHSPLQYVSHVAYRGRATSGVGGD